MASFVPQRLHGRPAALIIGSTGLLTMLAMKSTIMPRISDMVRMMPDRDVLPNLPRHYWAPACRLFGSQGVSDATVRAAERAVARSLREDPPATADRERWRTDVRRRLAEGILGPARTDSLRRRGIVATGRQEDLLLAQLVPSLDRFFTQQMQGKVPRARGRTRLSAEETLGTAISVSLTQESHR